MNGRVLLDTNIVIALFRNDFEVTKRLAEQKNIFIPSIALGELFYGAYKSTKISENFSRISEFEKSNSVLFVDNQTARHYGIIKSQLIAKGAPIPENDIWISAITLQHELTVITKDQHFKQIESISVEFW